MPSQGELVKLVDAGVKGFKCFMIESGVEVDLFLWLVSLKRPASYSTSGRTGIPVRF